MSINDLNLRDELVEEVPSELPEQGSSALPTVMPGISIFQLPADLLDVIEAFDEQQKNADGSFIYEPDPDNPGQQRIKVLQRIRLHFTRETPLVIAAPAERKDQMVTCTISNVPRNRARKNEPPNKVADLTYLIRTSLADVTSALNSPKAWVQALVRHAGQQFRAEHGLTAHCREDKVRYIHRPADDPALEDGRGSIEDPTGTKGCGKRYYTSKFRLPAEQGGGFSDIMYCQCGAKLRGFFQIERFLEPTAGMNVGTPAGATQQQGVTVG